jgi:hypothetical protein
MASKSTELTVQEQQQLLLNPSYQMIKQFELQQRMAQMYVQSTIVPDTYRGNIGNCAIAIDMAQRMGANPIMVMQNLYIVHGNPAWSSKFLIACINTSGRFTPLRYQFYGKRGTDQYGCRAYAYEKGDKEHKEALCGIWVTIEMAKKEGWTTKNGSKWNTMPDQMLVYRAAAFWARAYAPEISMGFLTKEEIEDAVIIDEIPSIAPAPSGDNEPEPPIDNQPEGTTDNATVTEPSANDNGKEPNKTSYRAPENHQDAAPAPKPQDKVAEALGKQSSTSKTAKELHEQYKQQKQQAEQQAEEETPTNVDPETGEILNNDNQEQ